MLYYFFCIIIFLKYRFILDLYDFIFVFFLNFVTKMDDDGLIENFEEVWTVDLDEIEFGEVIGKGAFGEVYKGFYFGTEVAVKKLCYMEEDDELYFQREVSALKYVCNNVNHHHLVLIFLFFFIYFF